MMFASLYTYFVFFLVFRFFFFFLMIRRPPRSTLSSSSAASDVYKRQLPCGHLSVPGAMECRAGEAMGDCGRGTGVWQTSCWCLRISRQAITYSLGGGIVSRATRSGRTVQMSGSTEPGTRVRDHFFCNGTLTPISIASS
eukprot:TRINITY_DN7746_c0_g2_i1.p1 TRINITY_DN7746_c0_g2~~TRINITY_DN7746_c0_g2_i1.p1  ORF type:complete len:140 (+),score=18.49 TRINITY_DN7746_c0_g2_i1:65-484(+)